MEWMLREEVHLQGGPGDYDQMANELRDLVDYLM
jgi:hypothetical protein